MKPAAFEYSAPESIDEVTALLAEHGDEAKVIAGGQSLTPMLVLRLAVVGHPATEGPAAEGSAAAPAEARLA